MSLSFVGLINGRNSGLQTKRFVDSEGINICQVGRQMYRRMEMAGTSVRQFVTSCDYNFMTKIRKRYQKGYLFIYVFLVNACIFKNNEQDFTGVRRYERYIKI